MPGEPVLSDAVKCWTSTYVLPAESVTLLAVGPPLAQVPTSTIMRSPVVMLDAGVTVPLATLVRWVPTCWTNPGMTDAVGVTGLEAAEAGPVPTELVAVTVNVYAVPFVNPVTVALVAGGEPVTVVAV